MALVANGVWLSDGGDWIPVELELATLDIRPMHRGWEAWRVHIHASDDRFAGLQNPIKIKLRTHGVDGQEKEVVLENWYVIQHFHHTEETQVTVIADVRSQLAYGHLTNAFNVEVAGAPEGTFRSDSLDGGQKWTSVRAIARALELTADSINLNLNVEIDPEIDGDIAALELPKNLSNTRYGGFFGAKYLLWAQIMGVTAHVDVVPTIEGGLMVVDKHTDFTGNLESLRPRGGAFGPKQRHWEQPISLIVQFNKRIERVFSYTENSGSTVAPHPAQGDAALDNVMPTFGGLPDVAADFLEIFGYTEFVLDNPSRHKPFAPTLRRGALKKALVPGVLDFSRPTVQAWLKSFPTAEKRARLYAWIEFFPQALRRLYRVRQEVVSQSEIAKPLEQLTLGRLNADGTTNESGVYMDYIAIRRYGFYEIGAGPQVGGGIYDQKFSENHEISGVLDEPAPFIAQWLSDAAGELLFEIRENNQSSRYVGFVPGLLRAPDGSPKGVMKYPRSQEIMDGEPQEITEASMELHPLFRMEVFYHGVQVGDVPLPAGGIDRSLHEIEYPGLFGQGTAPPLYLYVGDLTANFAHVTAAIWPGLLRNQDALQERADFIRDGVLADRDPGKHGSLRYSGAYVAEDVQVHGNIQDLSIMVSGEGPGSIMSFVYIAPEVKEVQTLPDRLEGIPPSLIG